ncbi:hypothetical protein WG66_017069, partial [Moniliophthora roreri]
ALFDLAVALDKENELFIQLELQINGEFSDLAIVMELLEQVIEQAMGKQSRQRIQSYHPSALYSYERMGAQDQEPPVEGKRERASSADSGAPSIHVGPDPRMGPDWYRTGRGTNRISNADVSSQRIRTAFSQALYILSVLRLLNKKTTLTEEIWIYFE